jgi:hypothetical protein
MHAVSHPRAANDALNAMAPSGSGRTWARE